MKSTTVPALLLALLLMSSVPSQASPAIVNATNVTLNSGSNVIIEIAGFPAQCGVTYSCLIVANNATLAGTLNVILDNGFMPAAGESFAPIQVGNSLSGTFDTLNLPALTSGLSWQETYDYQGKEFVLSIQGSAVPEPGSYWLVLAALGLAMIYQRRASITHLVPGRAVLPS
jgi:hypothetical protein